MAGIEVQTGKLVKVMYWHVGGLRDCPFCGCNEIDMWSMGDFFSPVCADCGATINENYMTGRDISKQVKAWNKRVGK